MFSIDNNRRIVVNSTVSLPVTSFLWPRSPEAMGAGALVRRLALVDPVTDECIKQVRRSVHRLAGLLSGIAAGLYCGKMAEDVASCQTYIADVQQLVSEANDELAALRTELNRCEELGAEEGR